MSNPFHSFDISEEVYAFVKAQEQRIAPLFIEHRDICTANTMRIQEAFEHFRLSDGHFHWHTGYGYDDPGREVIEKVYARIFGTEDALLRPGITSGTHAITIMLKGILRPGDHLLSITGTPYDTLHGVIGIGVENGSTLKEFGIDYDEIPLREDGSFDREAIFKAITEDTKVIYLQRSQGYSFRPTFKFEELEQLIKDLKATHPAMIIALDNCYGEFTLELEPTHVGVDVLAGSLIKNPGGTLAPSGGYVVGTKELIRLISHQLTSPALGKEVGGMFGLTRAILQGLYYAPHFVENAIKTALLTAACFEALRFEVFPKTQDQRLDIIQAVKIGSAQGVIDYCQAVQEGSPVDAFLTLEPWDMPGYQNQVIMAAGTFIQGASLELSADAPIREPFVVYQQGGVLYDQGQLVVMKVLEKLKLIES